MTPTESDAARPQRSALSRFVWIVAIFALLGPPIGGLTLWTMLLVAHTVIRYGPRPLYDFWNIIVGFVIGGYIFGVLPALAAGLGAATLAIRFGRSSLVVALAVPAILCVALLGVVSWFNPGDWDILGKIAILFVPSSLVASVVCWRLARGLLKAT